LVGYFDNRDSFEFMLYQAAARPFMHKEIFAAVVNEDIFEPKLEHIQPRDGFFFLPCILFSSKNILNCSKGIGIGMM
jgi:hypothetical protein